MDVYEKPRSKWYKLQSKPGKDKKDKDRGELEIRIAFTVKSGSLMDLSKKEKKGSTLGSSLGLGGGSLLSINTLEKKKKLKDFAKSLGSKVCTARTFIKYPEPFRHAISFSGSFDWETEKRQATR